MRRRVGRLSGGGRARPDSDGPRGPRLTFAHDHGDHARPPDRILEVRKVLGWGQRVRARAHRHCDFASAAGGCAGSLLVWTPRRSGPAVSGVAAARTFLVMMNEVLASAGPRFCAPDGGGRADGQPEADVLLLDHGGWREGWRMSKNKSRWQQEFRGVCCHSEGGGANAGRGTGQSLFLLITPCIAPSYLIPPSVVSITATVPAVDACTHAAYALPPADAGDTWHAADMCASPPIPKF